MADLSSLIRLHKHELDEKQRALGLLYDKISQLESRRDTITERREKEMESATQNPETVTYTLSGFLEKSKAQEEEINARIFTVRQEIEEARDEMLESFAELKKYELTQQQREKIEAEERKLKEGKMFDDIAIQGFRRKQEDNQ